MLVTTVSVTDYDCCSVDNEDCIQFPHRRLNSSGHHLPKHPIIPQRLKSSHQSLRNSRVVEHHTNFDVALLRCLGEIRRRYERPAVVNDHALRVQGKSFRAVFSGLRVKIDVGVPHIRGPMLPPECIHEFGHIALLVIWQPRFREQIDVKVHAEAGDGRILAAVRGIPPTRRKSHRSQGAHAARLDEKVVKDDSGIANGFVIVGVAAPDELGHASVLVIGCSPFTGKSAQCPSYDFGIRASSSWRNVTAPSSNPAWRMAASDERLGTRPSNMHWANASMSAGDASSSQSSNIVIPQRMRPPTILRSALQACGPSTCSFARNLARRSTGSRDRTHLPDIGQRRRPRSLDMGSAYWVVLSIGDRDRAPFQVTVKPTSDLYEATERAFGTR